MTKLRLPNIGTSAIVVGAILFVPVIVSFYYIGSRTIFNMFASDSMYYMGIANNYIKFGIPTFDGETATNGFHPLWELAIIGMFKVFSIQHHYQIYAVFTLSALLVYAAYVIISYTLVKILGTKPGLVATLTLFPGVYSIFFEPRRHLFNAPGIIGGLSPYSAINGMETSLSLVLWATFFLTLISRLHFLSQQPDVKCEIQSFFPFSTRLCLGLLVLCRLDDCFLVVAIGIFVLAQGGISFIKKVNALLHILWPTIVAIGIYVAFNELAVGAPLPVSGTNKMNLSAVTHNFYNLFMVWSGRQGTEEWWYLAFCLYTLIFALTVGMICVFVGRRYKNISSGLPETSLMMSLLNIFGLFLVLKAVFLFLFVPIINQGYWYYFPMVCICNVLFAIAVGFYVNKNIKNIFAVLFFCLAVILFRMPNDIYFINSSYDHSSGFGVGFPPVPNYSTIAYDLWDNSDKIRQFLIENAPNAKLIDNSDGMYVYLLDIPGESITGLASSPKEIARRKEMGILRSLVLRGFTIVPDYGYLNPKKHGEIRIVDELRSPLSPVLFYRIELN
jgi:hypothetical protein